LQLEKCLKENFAKQAVFCLAFICDKIAEKKTVWIFAPNFVFTNRFSYCRRNALMIQWA
jgi:hypothetical protein